MAKKNLPNATVKHLSFGDFGSSVMQDLPVPYKYTLQYFLENTPYPAKRRDFRGALYFALGCILVAGAIGFYLVKFVIVKGG
jgi:hypothetical protein